MYLEKGRTWMEVDFNHSTIEAKLRNRQIYWPPECVQVIDSVRSDPEPYVVKNLDHEFFKDLSKLSYYKSIRPGAVCGDPQVVDLKALLYCPDGVISYKLHHSENWTPLPRRPNKAASADIPQLYNRPLPIKKTK